MLFDGSFNRIGVFGAEGYQVAACQRIMLGLRHKIDGNQLGQSGFIGNHAYLRRARDHVDSHITGNELLCSGNEGIAGAGDLVYRLDALGSVCQCADSLSAAHGINLGYARNAASFQNGGIKRSVLRGRCYAHNALHARNRSGDSVHQNRGRVQSSAAGNVDAHGIERLHLCADQSAIFAHGEPTLLLLTLMEIADLGSSFLDSGGYLWVDLGDSFIDGFLRNTELFHFHAIEFGGVLTQGLVAALAHILDDVRCSNQGIGIESANAVEHLLFENLTGSKFDSSHGLVLLRLGIEHVGKLANTRIGTVRARVGKEASGRS